MILLCNMDATIIPAVIPQIGTAMAINVSALQWLTNGYCLAAMALFVIAGRLSDSFGRRPIFLLGTSLFFVGSVLAAMSATFALLVAARVLQGAGFAFVLSVALLMSAGVFPAHRRGLGLGSALTLAGAGQALGPLVGGWVLRHWTWPGVFWLNVPLVLMSSVGVWMVYPRERPRTNNARQIDLIGALLLAATLLSLSSCFGGLGKARGHGRPHPQHGSRRHRRPTRKRRRRRARHVLHRGVHGRIARRAHGYAAVRCGPRARARTRAREHAWLDERQHADARPGRPGGGRFGRRRYTPCSE